MNQLGINPEMDKLAREHGLGHWSCVSPLNNRLWVRSDGINFVFNFGENPFEMMALFDRDNTIGEDWQKPKQSTLVQKPFNVKIALDIEDELINGFVMTKNGGLANCIQLYDDGLSYCVKYPRKGSSGFLHYCNSLGQCYPYASGNDDYDLIIFVWE